MHNSSAHAGLAATGAARWPYGVWRNDGNRGSQERTLRSHGRAVLACAVVWSVLVGLAGPAHAQLTAADIEALRAQGEREGWTFTVSENDATKYPLEQLCGLIEPPDWRKNARFEVADATLVLPTSFDWRSQNGVTPIRNQGGCGSCWAFAAIGAMECQIRISSGMSTDLSEQWLVSCSGAGTCNGGWHTEALNYLQCPGLVDRCGGNGAVLESDFPYQAIDAGCSCPFVHPYCLSQWVAIGSSTNEIKQAIYTHGPVACAVYVNGAFQGYSGGVFNACGSGTVNHAVVLVGWNDSQGVWIMRNSWGTSWGESGYMRIPYGCSLIGYSSTYTIYVPPDCNNNGVPDQQDILNGTSPDCNENWLPDECELAQGTVPDCNGNGIPDSCDIASGTSPDCNGNGVPDECDLATGASTDCNGNGIPDECDIANYTSQDCNVNGLPDECEVATRHGLAGAYFTGPEFSGAVRGRLDPTVNFDWGTSAPGPGITGDMFSIRWTGFVITPPSTGAYTFYTRTDDGVRLRVAGQVLIDQPDSQGTTEWGGTLTLAGDHTYTIEMEYYNHVSGAVAQLSWQPPGQAKSVLPTANLIPGRDCNGDGQLDMCEFMPHYEAHSPDLSPLGGGMLTYTLAAAPQAFSNVTLTFNALGDLNFSSEYVDVQINGIQIGRIYTQSGYADCTPNQIATLTLPASTFNTAWSLGPAVVQLLPSAGVDPNKCPTPSYIRVGVSYTGVATNTDCNGNGIPDSCDVTENTSADCNGNTEPDECDIAAGRSADVNQNGIPDECESPVLCRGDCDCDGSVSFADIDYFVIAIPDNESGWRQLYASRYGGAPLCSFQNCDVNGDGHVNFGDIDPFVAKVPSACP